jgi:sec-independent protein translocase protein TatB
MFDIGFWELALIGILALVVLGPKRLPEAARAAGYWVGRIRRFIMNAKQDLDREMQGGGLDELRRLKEELEQTRRYIEETASKTGDTISRQVSEIESGFESTANRIEPARSTPAKKAVPKAKKKVAGKKTGKKKTAARKGKGTKTAKPAGVASRKSSSKNK